MVSGFLIWMYNLYLLVITCRWGGALYKKMKEWILNLREKLFSIIASFGYVIITPQPLTIAAILGPDPPSAFNRILWSRL